MVFALTLRLNYTVHYAELQAALGVGFKITKIHRVQSFAQSRWMSKYIMANQNKRKSAQNKFEKDFFKLMNNAVYGKTMENVRNRREIKLTADDKKK